MKKLLSVLLAATMFLNVGLVHAEDDIIDIGATIASDASNWVASDNDKLSISNGVLTTTADMTSYTGKKYGDGTACFAAKINGNFEVIENSSEVTWMGIALRQKQPVSAPWSGNECAYLVVVKPDIIELQKWIGGREYLIEYENKWVKEGEWHNYQFTTKKQDNGVLASLVIDGDVVFSYLDESDKKLTISGLFTLYNYTRPLPEAAIELKEFEGKITEVEAPKKENETAEATENEEPATTDAPQEKPATNKDEAPKYEVIPADDVKIFVNGKELVTDVKPVIVRDRTLVPMRAIFEAMGANVEWDGETRTVTGTKRMFSVKLMINESTGIFQGAPQALDVPPMIINDRTMVPVRVCAEGLNANVEWDGEARTISITDKQ